MIREKSHCYKKFTTGGKPLCAQETKPYRVLKLDLYARNMSYVAVKNAVQCAKLKLINTR